MATVRHGDGGLWARRRLLILRAIDGCHGRADRDTVLRAVTAEQEFVTQGPEEHTQKEPKYYFEQALRKLLDQELVESEAGCLALTPIGREVLADDAEPV